jgi:hypothetical protein
MKRGAVIFAIVALLLLADGSYLQLTNNQVGGDTGSLFGNQNLSLSAGTVVLVSGGLLLLGAIIMWTVGVLRSRGSATSQTGQTQATAQAKVAAGPGQARKESGDQH